MPASTTSSATVSLGTWATTPKVDALTVAAAPVPTTAVRRTILLRVLNKVFTLKIIHYLTK